jgi:Ca2+-binding EF-hand superfamily protein
MNISAMKAFVSVVSATLWSAAALASEDTSKQSAAAFESLDKNADEQISQSEAKADKALSDSFASMDSNGDGYLSKSEYMARSKSDPT